MALPISSCLGLIQAAAIGIGDRRHVAGVLEPTFDLETGDADIHQLRQKFPGR